MANSFDSLKYNNAAIVVIGLIILAIIAGFAIAILGPVFKIIVGVILGVAVYRLWQYLNK